MSLEKNSELSEYSELTSEKNSELSEYSESTSEKNSEFPIKVGNYHPYSENIVRFLNYSKLARRKFPH